MGCVMHAEKTILKNYQQNIVSVCSNGRALDSRPKTRVRGSVGQRELSAHDLCKIHHVKFVLQVRVQITPLMVPKRGETSRSRRIEIVMTCDQITFRPEFQTVDNSPLCSSCPTRNRAYQPAFQTRPGNQQKICI